MDEFRPASKVWNPNSYVPKFTDPQLRILAYGLTHSLRVNSNFAAKVYGDNVERGRQALIYLESWNCIRPEKMNLGWFTVIKEACPPKAWDIARNMRVIEKRLDAEAEEEMRKEEEAINKLLGELK